MPLLTSNSCARPWVHQEIGYALGIGVLTAYRHLTQRLDVAPQRIILAGSLVGGCSRAGNARTLTRAAPAQRDRFGAGDGIALLSVGTGKPACFPAVRLDEESVAVDSSGAPSPRVERLARPDRCRAGTLQAISRTEGDARAARRTQRSRLCRNESLSRALSQFWSNPD
jgi:hypothetical protein